MCRVLFVVGKRNPLVQTYEPKVNNLFHELWHIEKYFGAKQLPDSP